MIRITLLYSILFFGVVSGLLAQSDPKAGAKKVLTLRAAAEKVKLHLKSVADANDSQAGELSILLSKEMLERVEQFKTLKGGEEPGGKWIEQWRLKELEKSVNQTLEWAKEQSPLPIERAELLKRAVKNWAKEAPQKASEYARINLGKVYAKARELATEEQIKRLRENQTYPGWPELNSRVSEISEKKGQGLKPITTDEFVDLDEWLNTMEGNTEPVFEEVSKKAAEMSADFRREVAKQYKAQFETVKKQVEGNQYAAELKSRADLYASSLEQLKEGAVEDLEAKPPVYGTFEAIEKLVERASAHWETKRFEKYLKSSRDWIPNEGELESEIRRNITEHLYAGKSLKLLVEKYFGKASNIAAKQYGGEKLSEYFSGEMTEAGALAKTFKNQLRVSIKQRLNAVRQQIAEEQFSQEFASFLDDSFPEESVILWYYKKGKSRVRDFTDLSRSLGMDVDHSHLLEETRRMAVQKTNALLEPAIRSMRTQLELVGNLEKKNIEQLRKDVSDNLPVADILKKWELAWQELWNEKHTNYSQQWNPKFQSVDEELNKVVRQLYEGMQKVVVQAPSNKDSTIDELGGDEESSTSDAIPTENEQPESKQEEDKPEQTAQGGAEEKAGGVTEELETYLGLADGVFAFSDAPNGRCRMLFGSPNGAGAFSLEFDPQNIEGAAQVISEALKKPLGLVLDENVQSGGSGIFNLFGQDSQESELKMLFRVSSSAVRHQMSILVRQQVEEAISSWAKKRGEVAPGLLWQDDVEL